MKKILLTFSLAALSLAAFAQVPTFGIKGGANFAKFHISSEGTDLTATSGSNTLFNVGFFADFKFSDFSIQPAISLTGKGGKFTADLEDDEGNEIMNGYLKYNLLYIQVPVNLVYHVPVTAGELYFGAGPYVAYGISGTAKANDGSTTESQDVKFGDDEEFKAIDAGANALAGFKFSNGFLINVNYDLGLTNIANNSGEGSIKTRTFGVSVGYAF